MVLDETICKVGGEAGAGAGQEGQGPDGPHSDTERAWAGATVVHHMGGLGPTYDICFFALIYS